MSTQEDRTFWKDLSSRYRRVLELREAGRSYKEIAKEFGVSSSRIRDMLKKAEKKLNFLKRKSEIETKMKDVKLSNEEEASIRVFFNLNPTNTQRVISRLLRHRSIEFETRVEALRKLGLYHYVTDVENENK